MANKAAHMIANGRVQGVGFRFFVRDNAVRYGIHGWVKNLPDGTVEILAEGGKEIFEDFIEKVKKGPFFGHVFELTVEWVTPMNSFENFSINF